MRYPAGQTLTVRCGKCMVSIEQIIYKWWNGGFSSGFEFPLRNTLARVCYKAGLGQKLYAEVVLGHAFCTNTIFSWKKMHLVWHFVVLLPCCFQNSGFLKILPQDFAFCRAPLGGHLWAVIAHLFSWLPHFVAAFSWSSPHMSEITLIDAMGLIYIYICNIRRNWIYKYKYRICSSMITAGLAASKAVPRT